MGFFDRDLFDFDGDGRTDIGMNMRQTITEENLNKSEVRNWIITGARIVMGFI